MYCIVGSFSTVRLLKKNGKFQVGCSTYMICTLNPRPTPPHLICNSRVFVRRMNALLRCPCEEEEGWGQYVKGTRYLVLLCLPPYVINFHTISVPNSCFSGQLQLLYSGGVDSADFRDPCDGDEEVGGLRSDAVKDEDSPTPPRVSRRFSSNKRGGSSSISAARRNGALCLALCVSAASLVWIIKKDEVGGPVGGEYGTVLS